MRIGLFADVYVPNPNGLASSVFLLARELNRLGEEAWVVAPRLKGAPAEEERTIRVPSVPVPFEGHRLGIPLLRDLPDFDLIHTHAPGPLGLWGAWIAHHKHIPHVSTLHTEFDEYAHYAPGGEWLNQKTGIVPKGVGWFFNHTDAVIAPTLPIERLARSYQITKPVHVIPTGIDAELLTQAPIPASPWPEGRRRILTVSRMGKEKSLDVVLEAFAKFARAENAHLALIGFGPEENNLRAQARALGIADRVSFVGVIPYKEIGGYYRLAELFLFASRTETQGLVLLEAQILGVPVVAVGAEGTLSGVADGESGYLVAPGDSAALAERALRLLRDPELYSRFREGALKFGHQHSARRMAEEILAVYRQAASGYFSSLEAMSR